MSDELTLRASLALEKSGTSLSMAFGPTTFTVTGTNVLRNRQNVGTSEEALLLGDVAAGGYLIGINRDATNYLEIRPGSGAADLIKVGPGEFFMFRLAGDVAPYVIANTAAVELEYAVLDA